jgi:16S rRNA (guanine966-N2)-methyltransferase
VRIIAGSLRARRLKGPEPGELSIRPTSDRAREALFSILQRWPKASFLDLFSGTGAVALEAWSRGYAPVSAVERDPRALKLLNENARGTDIGVIAKDVRRLPADAFRNLKLIFADPPYAESVALWRELAPRLRPWLDADGLVVWETSADERLDVDEAAEGAAWALLDSRTYGAAGFHFLRPL